MLQIFRFSDYLSHFKSVRVTFVGVVSRAVSKDKRDRFVHRSGKKKRSKDYGEAAVQPSTKLFFGHAKPVSALDYVKNVYQREGQSEHTMT